MIENEAKGLVCTVPLGIIISEDIIFYGLSGKTQLLDPPLWMESTNFYL